MPTLADTHAPKGIEKNVEKIIEKINETIAIVTEAFLNSSKLRSATNVTAKQITSSNKSTPRAFIGNITTPFLGRSRRDIWKAHTK